MDKKRRFLGLKTKIMISTLIPIAVSFSLITTVIFVSFFNSLHETAQIEFLQIGQKHAVNFERKLNNALNYLSIVSSTLELQAESDSADRELLQKAIWNIFNDYELIDGSSVYFEPNMYDGKDAEYIGTEYGTAASGRICYYFYIDDGKTAYLPEAMENDIEFELPHYTEAKLKKKPIYTQPVVYEIDGKSIPMFTLTYPMYDHNNEFIGAVTVDLFLEDIYAQIQNEKIYETGYIIIGNDNEQIIYSPVFEDIGKTREEAGKDYALPLNHETSLIFDAKSILNGKDTLLAIDSIYIPQLDSSFYISVAAPMEEINASGLRLLAVLVTFSIIVVLIIGLLLYYLIGKISAPIIEITESANKIANGDMDEVPVFMLDEKNTKTTDEIHILSNALKKMLSQLNEGQKSKLETLEMKHKKEKAEAQAQAKNDFLAKMSHEIRTPMNAVSGMIELILRKDLPQDVYEDALVIKSSSANLLAIINDILDFSKIESGMLEITETSYLLPSLINDVINVIRIRLVDKPILFSVNIDPLVPAALTGDEVRIRQTLINLLSNAVKYTDEGYISLTVTGEHDGDTVMLTMDISDSGGGIKAEDIDKLFGNFVQVDAVRNKGIEGTGLGLAISRNLCRIMGGNITVSSVYGKGSTFTVTLPQKLDTYVPFASVEKPGDKSVLLYETRQVYRDSVAAALEALGVAYKSVESIPALFENMEQYPYIFVSSFMYGSVNPALSKLSKIPELVILSDITDTKAPKNARVLSMPAHALSIANILNDIYERYGEAPITGASFTAPDAKVLIVDDIAANLRVCEGLLLPYEMQVTLCAGGREAVGLVASNQYDFVFMDHMMPEIDGLEATRLIREMEGEYFRSLPIVALTANAVSGVREMFIQNGMNDFLAKPIETAKLNAVLEKWIPRDKRQKNMASAEPEEKNDFVETLRTVPGLSVDKALAVVGGSTQSYERIVRLSVRLLPDNTRRLNSLIESNLSNYAIEVHGVKGVLNNIGAYELGMAALELEELSKSGDLEACKPLHPYFIDKLNEFSDRVTAIMDKTEVSDKPDGDKTILLAAMPKVTEKIDFYDSAAALDILSTVDQYSYGQTADTLITDLKHGLERFDFDGALETIDRLRGVFDSNE